jgi:hypothetical protein
MNDPDLDRRFTYHAPKGDQADRYNDIRKTARDFAVLLKLYCPESREQGLALTHLEETVMWANASIARNEIGDNTSGYVAPNSPKSQKRSHDNENMDRCT